MRKTFFIADVHLGTEFPDRKTLVLSFLDMILREKGDLYILGDFFDFWANNRIILQNNRDVLEKMRGLNNHGLRVAMMVGNRDLLLNQKVLAPFGIFFLGEEAEISIDGIRIYLTHGHSLCTFDAKFQRYKKIAWPLYRFLDHIMPGTLENYLAGKFILRSKKVIRAQGQANFQFSSEAIQTYFQRDFDIIVCGHAHNQFKQKFGEKVFYALPSWEQGKGGYLLYHEGTFSENEFLPDSEKTVNLP